MSTFAIVFSMVNAVALLLLPLRWAALPLLAGACYMTLGQGIELGPFHFPVIRILIAIGLTRLVIRGEALPRPFNSLDWLMVAWAAWAVLASLFHEEAYATLVNRLGLAYNSCGTYFLLRAFCRSIDDVIRLCRMTVILLIPMAFEMLAERATGHNLFSTFGGVPELVARGGIIRAQGPFGNSILAGSIAASSLPLTFVLWHGHRVVAIAGIGACILMVYSSYSSGPILSTGFGILALAMWPLRMHMRTIRWLAFLGYFALELLMSAPVYFLIARMDVTGSSTAWHRAELIDAAIKHFSEWWLVGTDYTRHWMPYGIEWSPAHVDITNYYIQMGVYGGISLMLLFIAILVRGFAFVGQVATQEGETDTNQAFVAWGLGAALFVHAATFMSVSYFDQSAVFLYLNLAAISTIRRSFARTPLSQQDQNRTGSLHTQK